MDKYANNIGLCAMLKKDGKQKRIRYFWKHIKKQEDSWEKELKNKAKSKWLHERIQNTNDRIRSFYFEGYHHLTPTEKKMFADILVKLHHSLTYKNEVVSMLLNLSTAVFLSAAFATVALKQNDSLFNMVCIIVILLIAFAIGSICLRRVKDKYTIYIEQQELELITNFLVQKGILFNAEDAAAYLTQQANGIQQLGWCSGRATSQKQTADVRMQQGTECRKQRAICSKRHRSKGVAPRKETP